MGERGKRQREREREANLRLLQQFYTDTRIGTHAHTQIEAIFVNSMRERKKEGLNRYTYKNVV